MNDADFDSVCSGPLAATLDGLESARKKGVQAFWMIMAGAVVLTAVAVVLIGPVAIKLVAAIFILIIGWIVASMPLSKVSKGLKDPALAAICQARGLTYSGANFAPDGYDNLHRAFGSPNQRSFADRFGGEENGQPFAFYEAGLVRGSGKSRQTVFDGIIHTSRRAPVQGDTVVIPDKGLFNIFGAGSGGLQRVKFDDDPEFEKKFEVYSSQPDAARGLINPVVRAKFMSWRQQHAVVAAHIGGETVTVALADAKDRFEPGSMMKATPGRDRLRGMWTDLDLGLAQMRDVRSVLG